VRESNGDLQDATEPTLGCSIGSSAARRRLRLRSRLQPEFLYEGPPDSRVGDFTTMTIPLGAIIREIANDVFSSCFGRGVIFAASRDVDAEYVLALEGDLDNFLYRYTEIVDSGFSEEDPDVWIVPEVEIAFGARIFDSRGNQVLDRTYSSGVVEGERYIVTARPAERINQILHDTLHSLIIQVANDIYPLLIGECTVLDLDA
jgi:hypothetical protein